MLNKLVNKKNNFYEKNPQNEIVPRKVDLLEFIITGAKLFFSWIYNGKYPTVFELFRMKLAILRRERAEIFGMPFAFGQDYIVFLTPISLSFDRIFVWPTQRLFSDIFI